MPFTPSVLGFGGKRGERDSDQTGETDDRRKDLEAGRGRGVDFPLIDLS